ncbi:hypothetical protein GCM10010276_84830 [Streptomyces longisporus]|uniref:N-acetyltransferase domain-containing protein n=1 Tax=Streptomyces longisporus TaxID=1948 RepID=A0ABP6AR23_STRLO
MSDPAPESEEKLADRRRRYLVLGDGQMYRVVLAGSGESVGSVGFWARQWRGGTVWEVGWGVLPEFQGRGLARAARDTAEHRYLHAFPKEDNGPSNSVCRRAGFTLLGPVDIEYPKGHRITSNGWRVDLESVRKPG